MPVTFDWSSCKLDDEAKSIAPNMASLAVILGFGEIKNEKDAVEFLVRMRLQEKIYETFLHLVKDDGSKVPYQIPYSIIVQFIGMKTNVITQSSYQYDKRVLKLLRRNIQKDIQEEIKNEKAKKICVS